MREFAADDNRHAASLREVLNDPAFIANVGDRGVRTDTDAAAYMRDRLIPSYTRHGFGMWVVELRSTGEIIGNCGLLKRDTLDGVDIGFAFLERYRGHGYALEAALATLEFGWDTAQLDRVLAIVAPANTRSIALLTKLGLKFEKMIRLTPDSPEIKLFAIDRPKPADR